jgi:light-regulated signal transduction histidine kinase (bacteriophytochrome)
MDVMARPAPVDLSNCDREPIHTPGAIQPHGMLFVCDARDWTVAHVSANAPNPDALLGEPVESVIGRRALIEIRAVLAAAHDPAVPARLFNEELEAFGRQHIAAHVSGDYVHIELEAADTDDALARFQPLRAAEQMIGRLRQASSLDHFFSKAAQQVRAITGYDRVMIYRFAQDGSGEVIAESHRAGLETFLGLHYPASDIPKQARELYRRNWLRIIPDIGYERVPLTPLRARDGREIDLSFTSLRSVSPVHVEYLQNMGVGASMSISILRGDKLWGLIACHHYAPKRLPPPLRSAAELFAAFFSLQLEALERADEFEQMRRAQEAQEEFLTALPDTASLYDGVREYGGLLRRMIDADGFCLWLGGRWHAEGEAPPVEEIPALAEFLSETCAGEVYATNHLAQAHPPARGYADTAAGLLAIPLSRTPRDYLLFFRREIIRQVSWGGDPNKPVIAGPLGDRLTPRKSFEVWRDTVREQSEPWRDVELRIARALRVAMLEVVLRHAEQAAEERRSAELRQKVLISELNHRVKNLLGLIQSLVARSRESSGSLESFAENLQGRINALAFAHDQLTPSNFSYASLGKLIRSELEPYAGEDEGVSRITTGGPSITLDARAYPSLALVVHELATNASKYGALNGDGGRLDVNWRLDSLGRCIIDWRETGLTGVTAPDRRGFGHLLIRQTVPFELKGEARVEYEPDGLKARFVIPPVHIGAKGAEREDEVEERRVVDLGNRRFLVVEDNMLIALDAERGLKDHGAGGVLLANTVHHGLQMINQFKVDAAILDVNLGTENSFPLAEELRARSIPFIFATGYNDSVNIPTGFKDIPVIRKPYSGDKLAACVLDLLTGGVG